MLVKIFYEIDEFCKQFDKQFNARLLTDGDNKRLKEFSLSITEIMTICVYYHETGYKTFKDYYTKYVLEHMKTDFRCLVSYNRFIELRQKVLFHLVLFAQFNSMKKCTGISFIDSFSLKACHIRRVYSHKVFKGLAQKGKTSVAWFYGLKLHAVINHQGEIVAFCITPGNVSDCNENILLRITKKLFGKLFGDKGYIINQELFEKLYMAGIHLITKLRKNMKNKLMSLEDKYLLRKRGTIESVGSILKERLSMEHTRHRSITGFFTHIIATIIAYNFRENKPSIVNLDRTFITAA